VHAVLKHLRNLAVGGVPVHNVARAEALNAIAAAVATRGRPCLSHRGTHALVVKEMIALIHAHGGVEKVDGRPLLVPRRL